MLRPGMLWRGCGGGNGVAVARIGFFVWRVGWRLALWGWLCAGMGVPRRQPRASLRFAVLARTLSAFRQSVPAWRPVLRLYFPGGPPDGAIPVLVVLKAVLCGPDVANSPVPFGVRGAPQSARCPPFFARRPRRPAPLESCAKPPLRGRLSCADQLPWASAVGAIPAFFAPQTAPPRSGLTVRQLGTLDALVCTLLSRPRGTPAFVAPRTAPPRPALMMRHAGMFGAAIRTLPSRPRGLRRGVRLHGRAPSLLIGPCCPAILGAAPYRPDAVAPPPSAAAARRTGLRQTAPFDPVAETPGRV